ncbi:MAG: O-antigen ligase family protein [Microbacteriaceae bacterium]|nr:O-antigen ligase family protein [Microbacteriaceae bacterium]
MKTRLGVSAYAIFAFVCLFSLKSVRALAGLPGVLVVSGVLLAGAVVLFATRRGKRFRWRGMPLTLLVLLAFMAASVFWSLDFGVSLQAVAAQILATFVAVALATTLTWHEFLRTLATALRYILLLSLAFEAWLAFLADGRPGLLLRGGPIAGLPGSAGLLAFAALLALIVFVVQLRGGLVRPVRGWLWLAAPVAVLVLTYPLAALVAVGVVAVALAFAVWARRVGQERLPVYGVAACFLAGLAALFFYARDLGLGFVRGTANFAAEERVVRSLQAQADAHPWLGYGWFGNWPELLPVSAGDLTVNDGLLGWWPETAFLGGRLQLGWIGTALFVLLALMALQRVWCRAVDAPRKGVGEPLPHATSALFPWLAMVVLLVTVGVQGRVLLAHEWVLLIIFAVKSRADSELPNKETEPTAKSWRDVPIPR